MADISQGHQPFLIMSLYGTMIREENLALKRNNPEADFRVVYNNARTWLGFVSADHQHI
ncbi:hypothetical protein DET48_11035 [Vibrio diazotrophicus]|uniref:Uncharacterized protein n=1 Tax=Vibrio diazotrophicus TaxID=685 RepID=A0A329E9B4_VIBDI|nr:hypothetical protein DET48_11035 [Vibrio diazotrophicus]